MGNDNRDIAVRLENVSKTFYVQDKNNDSIRDRVFNIFKPNTKRRIEAVKPLNLEIKKGEFFSIIGRNGSGKSTLLNVIMGSLRPDKGGIIDVKGRMTRLSLALGFDPNLTARENVYVNGSVLGLSMKEIGQKLKEIIAFAELQNFIDTKVKFFSSGMRARLAFAVAIHAKADVFLFDEFFGGVGDIVFKKKSDEVFRQSMLEEKTIVLVSHSLEIVSKYSDRVLLLNYGEPVMIGSPEDAIVQYHKLAEINNQSNNK